jgi:hypothetical protein
MFTLNPFNTGVMRGVNYFRQTNPNDYDDFQDFTVDLSQEFLKGFINKVSFIKVTALDGGVVIKDLSTMIEYRFPVHTQTCLPVHTLSRQFSVSTYIDANATKQTTIVFYEGDQPAYSVPIALF